MSRVMKVSDSVVINADAEVIWKQVADPAQMPRWSPENIGATTPATDQPMAVGEIFEGTNRRGRGRWVTQCVVTSSDPSRRFAFDVRMIGLRRPVLRGRIATWSYDFEPVDDGTKVTETWVDARSGWPDWAASIFDRIVTGGKPFSEFQRTNIRRTLAKMKAEFESG